MLQIDPVEGEAVYFCLKLLAEPSSVFKREDAVSFRSEIGPSPAQMSNFITYMSFLRVRLSENADPRGRCALKPQYTNNMDTPSGLL